MKKGKSKRPFVSNKFFYLAVVFLVLLFVSLGVLAYGTNDPAVLGHSAGEIEGVAGEAVILTPVKDLSPGGILLVSTTLTVDVATISEIPDDAKELLFLVAAHPTTEDNGALVYYGYSGTINRLLLFADEGLTGSDGLSNTELVWLPLQGGKIDFRFEPMSGATPSASFNLVVQGYRV